MINLQDYIQEKLKINKDSKLKHDDLENYENDYIIDSFHKFFKLFMPFYGVNICSKIEKELEKYFQDFPLYGYLLPQNNNQSDGHKLRKKLQLNDKGVWSQSYELTEQYWFSVFKYNDQPFLILSVVDDGKMRDGYLILQSNFKL